MSERAWVIAPEPETSGATPNAASALDLLARAVPDPVRQVADPRLENVIRGIVEGS